ncbi:uncharacterized protein VTP21DRAFT_4166 [Calcarisporiella thermophila]|uniref:uncharacterized protein n=1 Tax=Calcarisporiella thermophila TaxID=911321 RepID=UPI00374327B5
MTSIPPDNHPSYADVLRVACTRKTKDPGEEPTLESVNRSSPSSSFKNSVTYKFSRFAFSSQEAVKLLYEKYQKQVAAIKILGHSKTIILAFQNEVNIYEIDFQYYGNPGWLQDHCYAILEPNPETTEPLENLLPRQLSIDEDKIILTWRGSTPVCNYCKTPGHIRVECPKKNRQHQEYKPVQTLPPAHSGNHAR